MEKKICETSYSSDKYHQSGINEKIRDNYFMFMTKKELMEYFYSDSENNETVNRTSGRLLSINR